MKSKAIDLPKQVLETISFLESSNDPRLSTIYLLITPREIKEDWDPNRDYPSDKAYEDMWQSIKRHEEKIRRELSTNEWVLDFIDDVIAAQELPQYLYLKNEKRLELIVKMDALTKELVDLYTQNSSFLNVRLKNALQRKDLNISENKNSLNFLRLDQVSGSDMAQILNSYTTSLINDIGSAEFLTKDSKGVEERMFAFALVKRNEFLYEMPLHETVATAMWAIYGRNNAESTISNIVKRSQEF